MQQSQTILFLYSRLPDYLFQCVKHFVNSSSYNVVIVRYRDDVNTKYKFEQHSKINLFFKDETNLPQLISSMAPAAIILSGWSDKDYVREARKFRSKIPVVLAMDNPWYGTLKQKMLTALAPLTVNKVFNTIWVTGTSQYAYALRLGFSKPRIISSLYSADTTKFYSVNEAAITLKQQNYPKKIVYVGRMVEYKQPHVLADVFNEIVNEISSDWELVLAGEGPLKEQIQKKHYKRVQIKSFIDPDNLAEFYKAAGIFCLPSEGEHWGVAVHEAAAAGLPLLLSDSVEAGTQFLIHGFNGYKFNTGDRHSLKTYLSLLMNEPEGELMRMSSNSVTLSKSISQDTWSANLISILAAK